MTGLHRKTLRHFNEPGHAHELTFSCCNRLPLLGRDPFQQWLVEAIHRNCTKFRYELLAFVIMPEHVHLIVRPEDPEYSVSSFLLGVKQSVSRRAANWVRENDPEQYKRLTTWHLKGRSGFRFWMAGAGYDRNVVGEEPLRKMIQYIHNNPVRRGLVAKSTDWEWSSAALYEDVSRAPAAIGRLFG